MRPMTISSAATRAGRRPAQSWNALTIGAYSAEDDMAGAPTGFAGYAPIAPRGELAPVSRTSVVFDRKKWPLKPDVVADGGNVAASPDRSGLIRPLTSPCSPRDCSDQARASSQRRATPPRPQPRWRQSLRTFEPPTPISGPRRSEGLSSTPPNGHPRCVPLTPSRTRRVVEPTSPIRHGRPGPCARTAKCSGRTDPGCGSSHPPLRTRGNKRRQNPRDEPA